MTKPMYDRNGPRKSRGAHTYLIAADGSPLVKIGYATNPQKRLKQLQTGQPMTLTLLWSWPGDYEGDLHLKFAKHRVRGEWFDLTSFGDAIQAVKTATEEIDRGDVPPDQKPLSDDQKDDVWKSPPADRQVVPPDPFLSDKKIHLTKSRAVYIGIWRHFGDRPFTVADVATEFGMAGGTIRSMIAKLSAEGFVVPQGGSAPRAFAARELPSEDRFGSPRFGAKIPDPR